MKAAQKHTVSVGRDGAEIRRMALADEVSSDRYVGGVKHALRNFSKVLWTTTAGP